MAVPDDGSLFCTNLWVIQFEHDFENYAKKDEGINSPHNHP